MTPWLAAFDATYCGPAPVPANVWQSWNADPVLIGALLCAGLAVRGNRAALAGVTVLAVIFLSPLCALSAALFSARVVHHVGLVAIAAPLMATALTGGSARSPVLPLVLFAAVLWSWHLPAAYDAALGNVIAYWAMQATLLLAALAFWRAVLDPRLPVGAAVLAVVLAYVQMALLGALLAFAPGALYAIHAVPPIAFGLSPLEDQQLGGLIMWVPAGLPFLIVAAWLARRGWQSLAPAG